MSLIVLGLRMKYMAIIHAVIDNITRNTKPLSNGMVLIIQQIKMAFTRRLELDVYPCSIAHRALSVNKVVT
ncbi:unnamed protein product [Kuraishia capsulata CBS 1993]|uniref:Uncharacterized protein n=1 Tax=Kuraishia capsulata CBS 1993 TaxID=1382522 RepID=W6MPF8_9ASCO|nr:uncharacterized protein KUCA_T00004562001 [Kuraishia capsulata CBS 1993]CDK28579.1 unnamed protein product [Kuraishia capsulata CBS 1993]